MKCLSCAGGGFFGYGEILIIQKLEELASKPAYQLFDFMAGTSAGAINTSSLSIGVSAQKVATFYTQWGKEIFKTDSLSSDLKLAPKYNNIILITALKDILTITENNMPRQATLKDCKVKWLATSLNMTLGLPTIFCSWLPSQLTPFGEIIGYDSNLELWKIVLCSTAAPTFFPGVLMNNNVYIDGGLTAANSPDSLLLNFIDEIPSKIQMLSIGSGDSKWNINPLDMIKPSDLHAAIVILETFLTAGVDTSNLEASFKLKDNYYHIEPTFNPTFAIDDVNTGLVKIPIAISEALDKNFDILNKFSN